MKIANFSQGATTSMPRMGHGFRLLPDFIAQGVHLHGRLLEIYEEKQEKWCMSWYFHGISWDSNGMSMTYLIVF